MLAQPRAQAPACARAVSIVSAQRESDAGPVTMLTGMRTDLPVSREHGAIGGHIHPRLAPSEIRLQLRVHF
jgi:hypothetical protein